MNDCGIVLVVDRDQRTRQLVADLAGRAGFDTRGADTGEAAMAALDGTQPALAIVEVELAGLSGLAVMEGLHEAFGGRLPVILVSSKHNSALDRAAGLMLGADDYIVKPLDPTELSARMRRSLARSSYGAGSRAPSRDSGLSPREHEILALLASGLSQPDIARQLVISPKTVGTHIQRILSKLGVRSRTQALAEAYRLGIVPVVR
jgi:DNA-binding NarL/FixJ family response regulator